MLTNWMILFIISGLSNCYVTKIDEREEVVM